MNSKCTENFYSYTLDSESSEEDQDWEDIGKNIIQKFSNPKARMSNLKIFNLVFE